MKKLIALLLALAMVFAMVACGAKEEAAAPAAKEEAAAPAATEAAKEEAAPAAGITIGYVVAGPDDYYNVSAEVVKNYGAKQGWEVIILNSEYTPEKEISNFEDLIAMGVDGIMCIAANTESVQTAANLAADAGIPTVFVSSGPAENFDTLVTGNWSYSGKTHAEYLNEKMPGAKVALVEGASGQGIANLIHEAFVATYEGEIVAEHDCNWSREEAMTYTQDLIASGTEVDVIFTYNDEMAAGAQQALEEAGYAPGEIWLCSNNGKPVGLDMLEKGWMLLDIEFAPTSEAYVGALAMQALLEGKEVNQLIDNPAISLTPDNIEDALTWDPAEFVNNAETLLDMEAVMALIVK